MCADVARTKGSTFYSTNNITEVYKRRLIYPGARGGSVNMETNEILLNPRTRITVQNDGIIMMETNHGKGCLILLLVLPIHMV